MKIKDMEKLAERAGEELDADVVAVAYGTRDWEQKYAQRARVLAVRQPRKVYSGQRWDWNGHRADDGVRVRYLDDEGAGGGNGLAGREEVVGPRQVVALWSDHRAVQKALAEREEAALARRKNTAHRAVQAAQRLGATAEAVTHPFTHQPTGVYTVSLTLEQAEKLAERLAELEVAS